MPNSKAKERERSKQRRLAQKRAAGAHLLTKADVRAMRKAGLRVEDMEGEAGALVSMQVFSALLRDRAAIAAHLSWHHESVKNPDIGTIVERMRAMEKSIEAGRIMQLEADLARLEAMLEGVQETRR